MYGSTQLFDSDIKISDRAFIKCVLYTDVLCRMLMFAVELEAIEACEWLREAGFPQYAQLYRSTYK